LVGDAGSVQLAAWILDEAKAQAAEIRNEARDEAAASLADARKEAAELLRQASDQAAAKLEAAGLEAAEVQAAVMKLSSELGEAAARNDAPAQPGRAGHAAIGPAGGGDNQPIRGITQAEPAQPVARIAPA
jgi:hypothetical protein